MLLCVCRRLPRRYRPLQMAANVGKATQRSWATAKRDSLLEQSHLMSSVVSLFALNPFVWPALLLAWLLTMSKRMTQYPAVRTLLYLLAVYLVHLVIYSIRAVGPLCFIVVAAAAIELAGLVAFTAMLPSFLQSRGVYAAVLLFCVAECAFYFWTLRRARILQRRVKGPELDVARRWLTYRRVEQSSVFVLPMCMPKVCTHWTRFSHLRKGAAASAKSLTFAQSSGGSGERRGKDLGQEHFGRCETPDSASNGAAIMSSSGYWSESEGVTPSARYTDAHGRPINRLHHYQSQPSSASSPSSPPLLSPRAVRVSPSSACGLFSDRAPAASAALFGHSATTGVGPSLAKEQAREEEEQVHPLNFLRGWFFGVSVVPAENRDANRASVACVPLIDWLSHTLSLFASFVFFFCLPFLFSVCVFF